MTEKTAIIKVYVKGETIGMLHGEPDKTYEDLDMKDVIAMINEDRKRDGKEAYRPSQLVGAQMLICYT